MPWYQIINATSGSYGADRHAEGLLQQFSAVLQAAEVAVDAEMFYGRTATGAQRYYVSLSPAAVALAERVLASYDATALTDPPDLTGMEKIRRW